MPHIQHITIKKQNKKQKIPLTRVFFKCTPRLKRGYFLFPNVIYRNVQIAQLFSSSENDRKYK